LAGRDGWAWPTRERGAGVSGPRAMTGRLAEEWAAVGENGLRRKEIPFFFSFSNFSKPNFKEFSNPNLNLIKPLISKI
jgi:hypothetical protein